MSKNTNKETRGCKKGFWGNLLNLLEPNTHYDSNEYNSFHKWYRRKLKSLKEYLVYYGFDADSEKLYTFSYYILKAYFECHSPTSKLQFNYSFFLNNCLKFPLSKASQKKNYAKPINPKDMESFLSFLNKTIKSESSSPENTYPYLSLSQQARLENLKCSATDNPNDIFLELVYIFWEKF